MKRRLAGATYTEADVLRYLGTPDLCCGRSPRHLVFAYFFDSSGEQDGAFMINFDDDGRALDIGWNRRTAINFSHSAWHAFDATPKEEG